MPTNHFPLYNSGQKALIRSIDPSLNGQIVKLGLSSYVQGCASFVYAVKLNNETRYVLEQEIERALPSTSTHIMDLLKACGPCKIDEIKRYLKQQSNEPIEDWDIAEALTCLITTKKVRIYDTCDAFDAIAPVHHDNNH